jgi:hypothetical protein
MKTQQSLLIITLTIVLTLAAVVLFTFNRQTVAAGLFAGPTPAPTATPGAPPPIPTSIPLAHPLTTKEQALARAIEVDAHTAVWDTPWSADTLTSDPGRISLEAFKSRTEESAAAGSKEWYAPEIEADAGAVWRITVKGNVHVHMLGMDPNINNQVYDGVIYVISQRTGQLLKVEAGLPKK